MRKHSPARFALLLVLFALTNLSPAEDNLDSALAPTYRTSASEVRVTFFATDEKNHPLDTVTKSDFAIVDGERVVRNFRSFAHAEDSALEVVVLVDLSESVAPSFRVAVSDVVQLVVRGQAVGEDQIAVLCFGGTAGGGLQPASAALRPRSARRSWSRTSRSFLGTSPATRRRSRKSSCRCSATSG